MIASWTSVATVGPVYRFGGRVRHSTLYVAKVLSIARDVKLRTARLRFISPVAEVRRGGSRRAQSDVEPDFCGCCSISQPPFCVGNQYE